MALFKNIEQKLYSIIKAEIKVQEEIVFTYNSGSAQYTKHSPFVDKQIFTKTVF